MLYVIAEVKTLNLMVCLNEDPSINIRIDTEGADILLPGNYCCKFGKPTRVEIEPFKRCGNAESPITAWTDGIYISLTDDGLATLRYCEDGKNVCISDFRGYSAVWVKANI